MGKKSTKLGNKIFKWLKGDPDQSSVSKINAVLEEWVETDDLKRQGRVLRVALKALGLKSKAPLGPLARNTLITFLCRHREQLTDKQRMKFVDRVDQFQIDLELQFGIKRKRK
ncbi:hypothetical protein H6778_01550 [Candidatus Nomurabacteria bacterium]|nr:hypothetical protein [Candidatus Nomurabacteria bacterium]